MNKIICNTFPDDEDNNNINSVNGHSDSAFENASSFEEARAIVLSRLEFLRSDLCGPTSAEAALFEGLCETNEEYKRRLMDFYACYYAPCRVSDTVFIPRGNGDMNDVMIDFSEGFQMFIKQMEKEYVKKLISRRRSTSLMKNILSLQYPYSRVLYLYYYKKHTPDEIAEMLHFSRATFFRIRSEAVNMITDFFYPPQDGADVPRRHGRNNGDGSDSSEAATS